MGFSILQLLQGFEQIDLIYQLPRIKSQNEIIEVED
jgi:hypothetical protein